MSPRWHRGARGARFRRGRLDRGGLAAGEETGKAYQAADQLLEAVLAGPGALYERALRQPPFRPAASSPRCSSAGGHPGRGRPRRLGQPTRRPVLPLLRRGDPSSLLQAMARVAEAREAAYGNVNPQILLAVLGEELAEVL